MASPTRPALEPGGKGGRTSPHAAEFAACIVTGFRSRPLRLYLLRLSNGVDQVGVRNRQRFPVAPLEPLHPPAHALRLGTRPADRLDNRHLDGIVAGRTQKLDHPFKREVTNQLPLGNALGRG